MSYTSATQQAIEEKSEATNTIRLATVTAVTDDGKPYVTFYGEHTQSSKLYKHIGDYIPAVNDVVAMMAQAKTYIILGKVTDAVSSGGSYASKTSVDNIINGTTIVGEATNATTASKAYKLAVNTSDGYELSMTTGSTGGDLIPGKSNQALGDYSNPFFGIHVKRLYSTSDKVSSSQTPYLNLSQYHGTGRPTFAPSLNAQFDLGTSSYQFENIYAKQFYQNGTAISTSDRNKKNTITDLDDMYKDFFKKLRPVTFKFNDGDSGRLHAGFIAQEVEEAMHDCGIDNTDFAGLVIQEDGTYGLRYEEFIAIQTAMIQDLQNKVIELERRLNGK